MLAKRLSSSVRPALTAAALTAALLAPAAQAQEKVLRAVMHADVRTLDPMWTTQTIAGIHGMIVYDTLFGNDEDGRPHPQMVGKYEVSQDRKTYDFTLRDGLKFHDGSPVATKDVIASIKRWGARDPVGHACSPSPKSSRRSATNPSGSSSRSPTAWCSSRSARPAPRCPSSCARRRR
jgi:peptide/nickel transport system substrate-binding protein